MNENKNQIIFTDKIKLKTSGDISKIPSIDNLFSKSFLQYNNNFIAKNYEQNQNILFRILKKIPGMSNLIVSYMKDGDYVVDFTKNQSKKIKSGEWELMKSKDNLSLKAILRDSRTKQIKGQANIEFRNLTPEKVQEILNTSQMLMIQQAIQGVSQQIEVLDEKVSDMLYGAQNDRLAYIQSGYNLFLQAQVSEKLKKDLYPIIIGQLNLGREQLIYSLQYTLKKISNEKLGSAAFIDQLTSLTNKTKVNQERINEIKQSLSFVIRSSQLLAIIYQDNGENWSMMQSILRLKELLAHFKENDFDILTEWSIDNKEIESLKKAIYKTKSSIDENIKILMENPNEVNLKLKTKFYE